MANVRLDERAFRLLDKFSNKKNDWKEWRTQLLTAIRECDTTFATTLVHHERSEEVIKNENLTPTVQQLSATLQARLVSVTAKEALAIVDAEQGEGIEAWRQLVKRFDPQTDGTFAALLISLVSFKITKTQDVQSELVRWETILMSVERDHSEKLSPKIRRALLVNILPASPQSRVFEHLDRLVDYAQVREKVVTLVQGQKNPDAMEANNVYEEDYRWTEEEEAACIAEEEAMDLANLSLITCHRCKKKGHMARDCKSSPKGGKARGKGTRFMGAYSGKGGSPSGPACPECGKPGHSRDKCWKLHPELTPAKFRKKVQGVEGEEDQLGVIEICSVEPLDPLYCHGNTNFEKQFPILSREIKVQNKYTLLEDDNDKWDPSGNKSVIGSVFLTTPMNKLQKISSRRIKTGEWSKIKLTPLPIPALKKPPVIKRAPVGVPGGYDLGKIQESTTS